MKYERHIWMITNTLILRYIMVYSDFGVEYTCQTWRTWDRILDEAHRARYIVYPGATKMYKDLREFYWWLRKKISVASKVAQSNTCQWVKIEHQKLAGLMKPLDIPEWKWEHVTMDFVTRFPRSHRGNDAIWVIIDRLTKLALFLPTRMDRPVQKFKE